MTLEGIGGAIVAAGGADTLLTLGTNLNELALVFNAAKFAGELGTPDAIAIKEAELFNKILKAINPDTPPFPDTIGTPKQVLPKGGIGDANGDGIPDILQSRPNTDPWTSPFGGAEALVCPVILDLDGNGIQTISTANGVYC